MDAGGRNGFTGRGESPSHARSSEGVKGRKADLLPLPVCH